MGAKINDGYFLQKLDDLYENEYYYNGSYWHYNNLPIDKPINMFFIDEENYKKYKSESSEDINP